MRVSVILLILQLWGNFVEVSSLTNACWNPPILTDGEITTVGKWMYVNNERVEYRCLNFYTMEGEPFKTCVNGEWIGQMRCLPVGCGKPPILTDGDITTVSKLKYANNERVEYRCQNLYIMYGGPFQTCMNGEWIGHIRCLPPLGCGEPPILTDGDITTVLKWIYEHNERVEYRCQNLYTMEGEPFKTCVNSKWIGQMRCLNITCEVGLTSAHLNAVGLPPANEAMVGHKIQFYCDDQYALEGSAEVECLQTGRWNADFPSCNENCKVPDQSQHINFFPNAYRRLRKGGKLTFSCHKHGHVLQGKAVVECLGNGQWSDPFPTCEAPLGCGKPPILTDGDITTVSKWNYAHNERVEYRCQNLYIMEGGPFKTCVNGEWTGQIRCIEPCTVDGDLMRAHNIGFKHGSNEKLYAPHNDHITFSCTRGRRHDGRLSMRQQCVDGVMHLPTCI